MGDRLDQLIALVADDTTLRGGLLRERAQDRRDAGLKAQWDAKGQIERGNPRRVFRGPEFAADR